MEARVNKPLVSAVMTVYNAGGFLEQAIDSVLNQTYENFELIILNDASTDNTGKIILKKQREDPRIKYTMNLSNSGLARARNTVVPMASGELIAIVDADDVNAPQRFERQVELLMQHPDIDIVGSSVQVMDDKGRVCDEWRYPLENDAIKKGLEYASTFANPSVMYRRDVFFKTGGYNEHLLVCEDWDFFYRAARRFNFANIAEPLVLYRFYESNTSVNRLENTVVFAVCFRLKLPEECFNYTAAQLSKAYPQHIPDLRFHANRF